MYRNPCLFLHDSLLLPLYTHAYTHAHIYLYTRTYMSYTSYTSLRHSTEQIAHHLRTYDSLTYVHTYIRTYIRMYVHATTKIVDFHGAGSFQAQLTQTGGNTVEMHVRTYVHCTNTTYAHTYVRTYMGQAAGYTCNLC